MSNCIVKKGAPTIETVGYIGQRYVDIDTCDIYECMAIDTVESVVDGPTYPNGFVSVSHADVPDNVYIWEKIRGNTLGPDLVCSWTQGISSASNLRLASDYEAGTDTVDIEGDTLVGIISEGQTVKFTQSGIHQVVSKTNAASGNKLTGVKIYPALRKKCTISYPVTVYPAATWKTISECLENNSSFNPIPKVMPQT